jgi:hypothetical protein
MVISSSTIAYWDCVRNKIRAILGFGQKLHVISLLKTDGVDEIELLIDVDD